MPRASDNSTSGVLNSWDTFRRQWSSTHDYSALVRLSRQAKALAQNPEIASRLTPVRLAVASSATVDFLMPILNAALLTAGVRASLYAAPYGQISSSLLDHEGALVQFQPQVTVVLHATPHLPGLPALADPLADVEARVDQVCRELLGPCEIFHRRTGSEIVLANFHPLPWRAAGNLGAKLPGDPTNFIRRVNVALGDRAPRFVHIFDVGSLAERIGVATWFDERYWYLAKQPLAFVSVRDWVRSLSAVIGGMLGRARKCVVVDLDNTLWGGVIGDDGLAGILIGEGSPEGEAFTGLQCYLRDLKERGVLLAVCSKNDEEIARTPFLRHPDMVLRLDDFAAFKANWQPKSENIRAIAREMDLPLDAFVFVDDNPAERDEVAQALPDVAVPDLPDDPAGFVRALDAQRLFEVTSLTEEDLRRTATYQARRQSRDALSEVTDLRSYLASLMMTASVGPFSPASFERVTQLVNKTNQFNLTTPRLVLADIERLASDPGTLTRSVRLRDRFGDHGLISVLFGHIAGHRLLLDAWLMSCRVLGRGVEGLLFNELLRTARARGLKEIVGLYRPSSRNTLVNDHYARLGFARAGIAVGAERWRLSVDEAAPVETFITVDSASAQAAV